MGVNVDALNSVLQPVSTAKGLPNEFYVDQETFDQEREHVFYKNLGSRRFRH